jgi:thiol-disulfide isomerase/thioredoxin
VPRREHWVVNAMISNYGRSALALLLSLMLCSSAFAGRDPSIQNIRSENLQVLVFETDGCIYCRIFRRDVLPQYQQSKRAEVAPIHFIDARKADVSKLGLEAPLTMVPTVVVMRDGREAGRISGYMGPEPFFHMMSQIVRTLP